MIRLMEGRYAVAVGLMQYAPCIVNALTEVSRTGYARNHMIGLQKRKMTSVDFVELGICILLLGRGQSEA